MRSALLTVALSIVLASPAAAQGLKLSFENGLVSIDATAVPIRTILTEWGRLGGTKIVGAERLAGAPLTLKLVHVSEAKALESILRSAAGYMAAPRATGTGPSTYDRILVMATSTAAPAGAASRPTPANNNASNGTQRFAPPRRQAEQQEQPEQDEPDENPPNPPVFTFPPQQGQQQPGMFNNAPPQLGGQPMTVTVNPQTGAPQSITINPAQPATNSPAMPTGAATPGVIISAPQQQQQPQPGSMIRPPGRSQ